MPENTTNPTSTPADLPHFVWLVFAALVVFVYLFGLSIPLLGPDEPRYTQVAREMFERGDWVTPMLGGHNWFEKPALLYWLQIAFFNLFGVSEFTARLGSALFGLGTLASIWAIGRSAASDAPATINEQRSTNSLANWLALIAASSLGLIVFSRGASFDIIITFPMTAALAAFFAFDRSETDGSNRSGWHFLALFYFFCGLAVLAKGLIGIVFPFAIVAFYLLISRRLPSRHLVLSLLWGSMISAAVIALWYLPMYARHGWEFIDEFIIQHHFQRFTSNKYQHPQPFFFFWWVLPLMTFPWVPFFLGAIWRNVRSIIKKPSEDRNKFAPLTRFAIVWMIVPVAFFSLSGSKLPGYILPAVPAGIVLTGIFIFGLAKSSRKWRNIVAGIGVGMLILILGLLQFAVPRFAETDSVKTLIAEANEKGYATERVLMFYTRSHNAEFYAAGRLIREPDGKQQVFYKTEDLMVAIETGNTRSALVLVPLEHLNALTRDTRLDVKVIRNNTELAIVAVTTKATF